MEHNKKSGRLKKTAGIHNNQLQPELPWLNKWLPIIVFAAVGILIFYPPYFRGLFFGKEIFITHILTALVFIVSWVNKIRQKDYRFMQTPLDWAVAAYAGAYLLSLIGAVHIGDAVYGFLKALNYFIVYWLVTTVVKNYRDYENLLRILLAGAVGVALIGISAAVGYYNYPSAFKDGVINSTLQYPNTLGAYLSAMSLIALALWIRESRLIGKFIYGLASFLLILVVLATVSKGAWLALAAGAFILLAGLSGNRLKYLYYLGITLLSAGIAASQFIPAIRAGKSSEALSWVLAGILIMLLGQGIWESLVWLKQKKGRVPVFIISGVLLVIGICGLFKVIDNYHMELIPQTIIAEISGVQDLENSSFTSRSDFYRAGLNIVKDYPINGTGAGGWNALYHQYLNTLNWATDLHNHFLQVWVETGTIGLLAFLSMWLLMLRAVFKVYKKKREQETPLEWVLIWGSAAAALTMGFHACIDFDLTYMAMSMILWALFALVNAAFLQEEPINIGNKPVMNMAAAALLALILLGLGSSYTMAYNNFYKGNIIFQDIAKTEDQEQKNFRFQQAVAYYQKAAEFDSLNADYQASLANVYSIAYSSYKDNSQADARAFYKQKSLEAIGNAEKLKPFDVKIISSLLESSIKLGDIEGMCRLVQQGIQANPSDKNAYDSAGKILWTAADYYIKANDSGKAKEKADQIILLNNKIEEQITKLSSGSRNWTGAKLNRSPDLTVVLAKSHYVLGDYVTAQKLLTELANQKQKKNLPGNINEMYAWYAASLYKLGQPNEAAKIVTNQLHSSGDLDLYNSILALPVLK